jgi:hypothetical protein
MTREEWVERLFDELWELYPQKIYREDAKETFSAIFPEGLSRETAERRLRAITERFAVLGENAKRLIQRGDKRYIPSLRNWLVKEGFGDV